MVEKQLNYAEVKAKAKAKFLAQAKTKAKEPPPITPAPTGVELPPIPFCPICVNWLADFDKPMLNSSKTATATASSSMMELEAQLEQQVVTSDGEWLIHGGAVFQRHKPRHHGSATTKDVENQGHQHRFETNKVSVFQVRIGFSNLPADTAGTIALVHRMYQVSLTRGHCGRL